MQLYNTLTREKEKIEQKPLKIYTCGPTVYNFAHIGNLRTYAFEDLLIRTLHFLNFPTERVMNLTDVDDKTIKGALENKCTLNEYTQPYIEAFFGDLKTLGILPADHFPRATDYIAGIIAAIEKLLSSGHAYVGQDGSVYFSIRTFPSYGKLSHLKLDELQVGASARVITDEYDKENASDFVLWKKCDIERDGPIFWESPFGRGRPGWHIECSVMAMKLLGPTLDIHCGGVDNIFPHHENEIAQSESLSGKPFVKIWLHSEYLIVDGKKMSKSLGNFYTLRDLLEKGYSGDEVRFLLINSHYRQRLNFTMEGLVGSRAALQRFGAFFVRLRTLDGEGDFAVDPLIGQARARFTAALSDDLNAPLAIGALFELVRQINALCDERKIGAAQAKAVLDFFVEINKVLFCLPLQEEKAAPADVVKAAKEREEARLAKNWQLADSLRDFIREKGYELEDTPNGARLIERK